MRREAVIGRYPDVECLQSAGCAEPGLEPAQLRVHRAERGNGGRMPDTPGVGGGVRIAEPDDGDRGIDTVETDLEKRVDDVAVAGAVGQVGGRRRPEPLSHGLAEDGGQGVLVVDDAAAGDRVIQQIGGAAGAGAGDQQPQPRPGQPFAERRRREQPPRLDALDAEQVGPIGGAQEARGVDAQKEDRVAQQAVPLRVGAGGNGGRVDARHGRIDCVMIREDDAPPRERMEIRHQRRLDVVGPQAVEDD